MFDNNDFYNLLTSGHKPEDVAAAFAAALNQAEARVKAEEEAKIEAERQEQARKKAEEAKMSARVDDLACVLREFCDFLEEYYPDITDAEEMDSETLHELAAAIIVMLDLSALKTQFQVEQPTVKTRRNSAEDAFAEFFKNFGL